MVYYNLKQTETSQTEGSFNSQGNLQ